MVLRTYLVWFNKLLKVLYLYASIRLNIAFFLFYKVKLKKERL
ncbi:hypothetical protein psyc5s11_39090 [Clostridium gelidum]|uniref:Uncharacterized protein n=1 Tax=Clostridium gelidum TaxID=704125 RepID=A0ABM7TG28_9CLOT|nr:hypothetical protein psyc5s11_39090 [Clostridium gelidum]